MLAEIEERERSTVGIAQTRQRLERARRVEPLIGCRLDERRIVALLVQLVMMKAVLFAASAQDLAVQRGKQPRLDLRPVAQLMTFVGPDREGLLGHVTRFRFA